jgi:hypothetical protein
VLIYVHCTQYFASLPCCNCCSYLIKKEINGEDISWSTGACSKLKNTAVQILAATTSVLKYVQHFEQLILFKLKPSYCLQSKFEKWRECYYAFSSTFQLYKRCMPRVQEKLGSHLHINQCLSYIGTKHWIFFSKCSARMMFVDQKERSSWIKRDQSYNKWPTCTINSIRTIYTKHHDWVCLDWLHRHNSVCKVQWW